MSIAILFNQKHSDEWLLKMQTLMPDTKVEVYPTIEDKNNVEFILTWKPHEGYINEFPNLRVIQSVGAGIDHLLHTAIPNNVQVTRIVDPNLREDMFEHILTTLLISLKNFPTYFKNQLKTEWSPKSYQSIHHTTVTVLGLGEIGGYVAEKLALLGFQVKGWSNSSKAIHTIECFVGLNELEKAITNSDYIVNVLPLTSATVSLINTDFFEMLSNHTRLINVGRGGHVQEDDLIKAIQSGKIVEAYLDVFILEPLPKNHEFWTHPHIYITPHIASITHADTALSQVIENYKRMQSNSPLLNRVDMQKGY